MYTYAHSCVAYTLVCWCGSQRKLPGVFLDCSLPYLFETASFHELVCRCPFGLGILTNELPSQLVSSVSYCGARSKHSQGSSCGCWGFKLSFTCLVNKHCYPMNYLSSMKNFIICIIIYIYYYMYFGVSISLTSHNIYID